MTKKDAYFFSHDSNARHDPKITAMRSIYGYQGYGWFWAMIEILREDKSFKFPLTKMQLLGLAKSLDTNIEMLQKFLNDCVEIGLFYRAEEDGEDVLRSRSLDDRMGKYLEIIAVKSKAGKKGNEIRWQNHRKTIAEGSHNDRKVSLLKETKLKETKLKETKLKENKDMYSPIVEDLNKVVSSKYRPTNIKTKELIDLRIKDGFYLDDFKAVHRNMERKWGSDEKMCSFLRPITLYSNKFESYLNIKEAQTKVNEAGLRAIDVGKKWVEKKGREDARS